jgi:hypothetical protein
MLAEVTELSLDSVQRSCALLEQGGFISIEPVKWRGPGSPKFRYRFKTGPQLVFKQTAESGSPEPHTAADKGRRERFISHDMSRKYLRDGPQIPPPKRPFIEENQILSGQETSLVEESYKTSMRASARDTSVQNMDLETSKKSICRPSEAERAAHVARLFPHLKRIPRPSPEDRAKLTREESGRAPT